MTKQLTARALRDKDAAIRASDQARALWWQAQANQPKRCGSCGAPVATPPAEGDPLPCGH